MNKLKGRRIQGAPTGAASSKTRRGAACGMAVAALATVGLGVPASASASSEYFFASSGTYAILHINELQQGNRHSLTRISARHYSGANPNLCVYGADGNNANNRNTGFYCAVSSDLADVSLGGILRYPWVVNNGGDTYTRALSEW